MVCRRISADNETRRAGGEKWMSANRGTARSGNSFAPDEMNWQRITGIEDITGITGVAGIAGIASIAGVLNFIMDGDTKKHFNHSVHCREQCYWKR